MYFVVVSNNVLNLKGQGEEWLVDNDGNLLAKFWNGAMVGDNDSNKIASPSDEVTRKAA